MDDKTTNAHEFAVDGASSYHPSDSVRKIEYTAARVAPLQHHEHFTALASVPDDTSLEWRSISAGLLVLRLVDRLMETRRRPTTMESRAAGRAIHRLGKANLLANTLSRALDSAVTTNHGALAAALRDYGRSMWMSASWTLAIDAYTCAAEVARVARDARLELECLYGIGYALRVLRRYADAATHYASLYRVATLAGDARYQLEARLGIAKISIDQGYSTDASRRLDRIVAAATETNCRVVLSKALHDSARLAGDREDHDLAARLSYAAWDSCDDVRERDRITINIGLALSKSGDRAAARDANLLLVATAQEQEVRWTAAIHLMELAHEDNRVTEFDAHREELSSEQLTPLVATWYYNEVGAGSLAFERIDQARTAYARMLTLAERHHLDALAQKARAAMRGIGHGQWVRSRASDEERRHASTPEVRAIAAAVTGWRVAAGLPG